MKVEQLYTGCLAQGAYFIASNGEAAIIDPLRETTPYLKKAEELGVEIKYIFETHFHADFVSGHLDLAKKTGAKIIYGPNAQTGYEAYIAQDGEEFVVGNAKIKALHTPGHTLESTTFLLYDAVGKPQSIFTGDTLFIGDVGRPDLAIKSDLSQEDLAGMLYNSLRNKIMVLPDDVIVYPAHGAGSACGKNMSKETWDTLGNQKKKNYALRADMTKEDFIKEVTSGLLPPPQYFSKNAMLNKEGYESLDEILSKGLRPLSVDEFEKIANEEEALVLDTRNKKEFTQEHIPGSLFIGIDGGFAPWVGTIIEDIRQPILIIADEGREEEVVTRLARVGYDHTLGFLKGGIEAWKAAGKELSCIKSISAEELAKRAKSETMAVLDVRKPSEYEAEHAEIAETFPLDFIHQELSDLPNNKHYYIHCLSGYRSLIAASLMQAKGYNITDVDGGFKAILETDIPRTSFVCPTTKE